MSIPVKIYGRDFTSVDYTLLNEAGPCESGVWIDFSKGKGDPPDGFDDIKRIIVERLCEVFLSELEKDKNKRYKKYIEQGDSINKRKKEKELNFIGEQNGKIAFSNIVGVIQVRDWSGGALKKGKILSVDETLQPIDESDSDEDNLDDAEQEGAMNQVTQFQSEGSNTWNSLSDNIKDWISEQTFDITLQIGSRFDGSNTFFLPEMLMHKDGYEYHKDLEVPAGEDDLFEFLLLFLFKKQLQDAYVNGPYKTYTRFEKNDSKLRGVIDIARHIKLNMGIQSGNIAYSYRENSVDNPMNHLILLTYRYIVKRFPVISQGLLMGDADFAKIITSLTYMAPSLDAVDLNRTVNKCRKIIAHPFHYRYERLRKTCLMILRHIGLSMFDSTEEEVQGILFYVPDLWEQFLEYRFNMNNMSFAAQDRETRIFISQKKAEDGTLIKGKGKTIYPDFVFKRKDSPIAVWDAKYKKVWGDIYIEHKQPYDSTLKDYDQCNRYMTATSTNITGTIFPIKEDRIADISIEACYTDERIKVLMGDNNFKDKFYMIPIIIPPTEEVKYEVWSKKMNENIDLAISKMRIIIEEEETRRENIDRILEKVQGYLSEEENHILLEAVAPVEVTKTSNS